MRESAKGLIHAAAEMLWTAVFAAVGRLYSPSVERWQSAGGRQVLVVAPHPDDEVIGCAGTLIRHRQAGDAVCIVYVTDGSGSRAAGLGRDDMARLRKVEAGAAAHALRSSDYRWLGFVEGSWSTAAVESRLADVLSLVVPDIVYVPSRIDFHPEHHRIAASLARVLAVQAHGREAPVIRIYQAQVPLTPLLTNLITETESVAAEMRAAFRAHASQSASIARSLRARRYAGRYYRASGEAEEFWQLSALDYCALHGSAVEAWSRYVSLRESPISDPRAYLDRLRERRRLARQIATV